MPVPRTSLHRAALLFTVLLSFGSRAQQLNTAKLDSLLTTLAASNRMMGSLAIARQGQLVYSRGFGSAQLTPPIAATPATRYRVNALDRVFTTVMIYQLIEEGKLSLETPLATFLPQVPRATEITIDHLLTERSGLQSVMYQPGKVMTPAELIDLVGTPQPHREIYPGTPYVLANEVLLQAVVARATKQPYAQALQTRVLAKANLQNTAYSKKIDARTHEATGYEMHGTGWEPKPETERGGPTGTGTLVSTPTDLVRFTEALYEGRLVSATHLKEMQEGRMGLPHVISQFTHEQHPGYSYAPDLDHAASAALVAYFPAEKLTIAFCTNARYYELNKVITGVIKTCFGKPYALPSFPPPVYQPSVAELDGYVGNYAAFPLRYAVKREGHTLRLESAREASFTLEPVSPGRFKHGDTSVEFAPDQKAFLLKQRYASFVLVRE